MTLDSKTTEKKKIIKVDLSVLKLYHKNVSSVMFNT